MYEIVVRGVYRHKGTRNSPPRVYRLDGPNPASVETSARLLFHKENPGFPGAVFDLQISEIEDE